MEEREKEKSDVILILSNRDVFRCDEMVAGTFVVDLSVSVNVCFPDHLVYFFVRQLLAQVRHHVTQLGRADVSVTILNKDGQQVSL